MSDQPTIKDAIYKIIVHAVPFNYNGEYYDIAVDWTTERSVSLEVFKVSTRDVVGTFDLSFKEVPTSAKPKPSQKSGQYPVTKTDILDQIPEHVWDMIRASIQAGWGRSPENWDRALAAKVKVEELLTEKTVLEHCRDKVIPLAERRAKDAATHAIVNLLMFLKDWKDR